MSGAPSELEAPAWVVPFLVIYAAAGAACLGWAAWEALGGFTKRDRC